MAVKTRNELKDYFKNGNVVKEQYFTHLIDSTLNQAEDNLQNNPKYGLSLTPSRIGDKFISFFKKTCTVAKAVPLFFFELLDNGANGKNSMALSAVPDASSKAIRRILSLITILDQSRKRFTSRVGINNSNPEYTLDVNGTIGTKCLTGTFKDSLIDAGKVIADSEWYSIVTSQKGFKCFEVSAIVSSVADKSAIVGKTLFADGEWENNLLSIPEPRVIFPHRNQLELRWEKKSNGYDLQIRTNSKLKGKPAIQYKLTKILL